MRVRGRLLGLPGGAARCSVCPGLFHARGVCAPRLLVHAGHCDQRKRLFRTPLPATALPPLLFRGLLCPALQPSWFLRLLLLSIQPPWLRSVLCSSTLGASQGTGLGSPRANELRVSARPR